MTAVDTNAVTLEICRQSGLGTLGSPTWYDLEPNSIGKWGAEISTVMRRPISKDRTRRASTTVDLDSGVEFETDLTYENMRLFIEGAMQAAFTATPAVFVVTAVTSTGYTVASGGALPNDTLVWASGFATAANNGLKLLAGTSTGTEIKTTGLTAEAAIPATQNARVEVCGRQAAANDLVVTAGGDITSTLLDFTTLGLTVGQMIYVGDVDSGAAFAFATCPSGFARIRTIAAGQLTLDKNSAMVADAGSGGKTIRLLFGQFLRDYAIDHASYLKPYFRLEAAFPALDAGTTAYSYPQDCLIDMLSINVNASSKATMNVAFVGTDTPVPTITRATNAASPLRQVRNAAVNTSNDVARLRITEYDEDGLASVFKSLTVTLKNNITPEKVVGDLGAYRLNNGYFDVDVEATLVFDDPTVWDYVRNNTKATFDLAMANDDDGGWYLDLPSVRIGNGKPGLPINETVTTDVTIAAEKDATLGYQSSFSMFPYLPPSATA